MNASQVISRFFKQLLKGQDNPHSSSNGSRRSEFSRGRGRGRSVRNVSKRAAEVPEIESPDVAVLDARKKERSNIAEADEARSAPDVVPGAAVPTSE
jgi:hypothetical protein